MLVDRWQIPLPLLVLMVESELMSDTDALGRHAVEGLVLITMLVSIDAVRSELEISNCAERRIELLKALSDFAHPADDGLIRVVCAQLAPQLGVGNKQNRLAALDALSKIVQARGEPYTVDTLRNTCAHDRSVSVRKEAIRVLGIIAEKGDTSTVSLLINLMADIRAEVRSSACDTLKSVACKGDAKTIAALLTRVHVADTMLRLKALEALASLSESNDASVVGTLRKLLTDEEDAVRSAAQTSLKVVCDQE
eukprot:TRINITY_DN55244_c0_g1_i1.p1 TRINITY_DN55244_c0_g1~~TRINITY_DN55244_c0_g1_i1.p1  ORF type:complete len:252 (-),score=18.47 TRINITY_DN55244_c0_g1_i1:316-1071(-)